MKTITLIASIIFVCMGCKSSKTPSELGRQNYESLVIEYVANTRGFYQKIVLKDQTVSTTNDRSGIESPSVQNISLEDWNYLLTELNKIDLDALSKLKAPTEKRFYDGAAIAFFRVILNGKTYETTNFDHEFPPNEIKKIVEIVNALYKVER